MSDIATITGGALRIGPGTLYTTIKRLLADGLIEESGERPDPAVDDQRRRYYRLTGQGREAVASEVRRLDALVAAARPWALEARR
jgi:DNA-binding PadR family transcriptional regulator